MRRLLWVGDAACDSGFSRATHYTLEGLDYRYRGVWECGVLGINYRGYPHDYKYPIFPCWPGGDAMGAKSLKAIIEKMKPDVVVFQNDPWNIPRYVAEVFADVTKRPILMGTIAVDGVNCRGTALNGLDYVLFWTEFAQREAKRGGLRKPSGFVPLGVDLTKYKPGDRTQAREKLRLPEDVKKGFIVLNMNRNQPRKRLDLTVRYFAKWVRDYNVRDAFLYLHVCPTGDVGYDCEQLSQYYGIADRLILSQPEMFNATDERWVVTTQQACDIGFSTTQGEGWGLCTAEMMACRKAQVVPRWAAFDDKSGGWLTSNAAMVIPSVEGPTTPVANAIGGLMDESSAVHALDAMYRNPKFRDVVAQAGFDLVNESRFRWENIASRFAEHVEAASCEVLGTCLAPA